ncbi:MFS transporter [Bacillus cereus]|uniref:MFS transporter n=1 Tax=Bacillus cereus TaxID=1396 RepID=UPI0039811813
MTPQYKFKLHTIFEHWPYEKVIIAETEERARFQYWQTYKTKFTLMSTAAFMKFVRCENLGVFDITQLYSKEKHFKKMQKFRKLDFAYMGMRVQVAGMWGMIVGNWKTNLFVLFDGEIEKHNCHPYWEIAYYDEEGNVVRDFRRGEYAI